MSGPVRRLAYWTVPTSGLRRNELGSLTPKSFDFRGASPLVRVEGRHAKNRRPALPLRTDLAAELKAWLVDKPAGVPVFPVKGGATSKMLAADLAEAGITSEKDGRQGDFHTLRITPITQLALAGVHLVVAQRPARHSTPALTAKAYSVFGSTELQKAVEQLPSYLTVTHGTVGGKVPLTALPPILWRRVVCLRSGLRPSLRHTTQTVTKLSPENWYKN
jgi:integrase